MSCAPRRSWFRCAASLLLVRETLGNSNSSVNSTAVAGTALNGTMSPKENPAAKDDPVAHVEPQAPKPNVGPHATDHEAEKDPAAKAEPHTPKPTAAPHAAGHAAEKDDPVAKVEPPTPKPTPAPHAANHEAAKDPAAKVEPHTPKPTPAPHHAAAKAVYVGEEAVFDAQVIDILWYGQDKNTLLLHTRNGGVHRSTTHGETWADMLPTFKEIAHPPTQPTTGNIRFEDAIDVIIGRIAPSAASPTIVLALAVAGPAAGFVSQNAGETWRRLNLESRIQSWSFHELRSEWALVSYWSDGCRRELAPWKAGEEACTHDLYVTQDAGRSFSLVQKRIVQYSWGPKERGLSDTVFFTHFKKKDGGHQEKLTKWMNGIELARSDIHGGNLRSLLPDGNKFQLADGFLLVVTLRSEASQLITLMVSWDGGESFKEALLPHSIQHRAYTLLDTSEGAIVLHVHHTNTLGDIFISDQHGVDYSLALENNVRKNGICAFEKVMGINGLYIANVVQFPAEIKNQIEAEISKEEKREEELPPEPIKEGASSGTQSQELSVRWRRRLLEHLAAGDGGETAPAAGLGNDGGSGEAPAEDEAKARALAALDAWLLDDDSAEGAAVLARRDDAARRGPRAGRRKGVLSDASAASSPFEIQLPGARPTAPLRRASATSVTRLPVRTVMTFDKGGAWRTLPAAKGDTGCQDAECSLHLHAFTDLFDFAPVYSYKNAIGIVMGSGNVGKELDFSPNGANTYLSRDGGLTWQKVMNGTYIYEYGNHGGLIVMANMLQQTGEALYSFNEGQSFKTFKFEKPFEVKNVMIEPDATAKKFVLYGSRDGKGIFRHLDFSGIHERECKGVADPGGNHSDYEYWSPTDKGACILGHRETFVRRVRNAKCHNAEMMERPKSQMQCNCTKEDFECEVGFERDVNERTCKQEPDARVFSKPEDPVECQHTGNFTVDAYRKVPLDTCKDGFQPHPVKIKCTGARSRQEAASEEHVFHPPPASAHSSQQQHPVEHWQQVARPGDSAPHSSMVGIQAPEPPSSADGVGWVVDFGVLISVFSCTFLFVRHVVMKQTDWFERLQWSIRSANAGRSYAQRRHPRVGAEMVGARAGGYAPPSSGLSV